MQSRRQHMPRASRRVTPVDQYVGKRIRIARLAAKISQEKLAAACGVSFQQVQKYENGVNRVGAGRLPIFARVLGVDVRYFFDGAPTATKNGATRTASRSQQIIDSVLSSPLGMRLNKAFAQITDRDTQYRVVELVERMVAAP